MQAVPSALASSPGLQRVQEVDAAFNATAPRGHLVQLPVAYDRAVPTGQGLHADRAFAPNIPVE
jgi:hypothetical protein